MTKKKLFTPLFVIGILIELLAFFISQTANIPFLLNILSPNYVNATAGLDKLETKKLLIPKEDGFTEIENIFINLVSQQNPPSKMTSLSVLQFYRKAEYSFNKYSTKVKIPILVKLSNDQEIEWDFSELKDGIEKLKIKNIFIYALFIFLLGVILQGIDEFIELKKT